MNAKFLCLYLYNGGDKDLTNNTLCIPNPMPTPQYAFKVFSAKPAKGTVYTPSSGATLTMVLTNSGAGELNTMVRLYASEDATLDPTDDGLSQLMIGKVPTGGVDHSVVMSASFNNPVMQSTHKYLCAVVGENTLEKDPNKDDNAKCVAATFVNPPDLGAGSTSLWTADASGNAVNFPQWGDSFGCRLDLANYGTGNAVPTKVRCFIAPDGTAVAQPTEGWWDIHFDVPAVKGEDKLVGVVSQTQAAITKPMPYGKVRLCAMINWPKNQDEVSFSNNEICRPYTIMSMDLFPRPDGTHLYVNSTKDPKLTKLKIGTAYKVNYQIGNKGNLGSTNKTLINQMTSRIVLSKDQQYDSSDITIFESKGGYGQIPAHGKTYPWYGTVMWAGNDTATVSAGTPTGAYVVLFVADATDVFKEPEDNNVHVYGSVTVE